MRIDWAALHLIVVDYKTITRASYESWTVGGIFIEGYMERTNNSSTKSSIYRKD